MKESLNNYTINYKEVLFNNDYYYIPEYAEHRYACQSILQNKQWEVETLEFIKEVIYNKPGNIIHAGTFFGDMLPFFSSIVDEFCYAFEPVLENYIMAKLCINKNKLSNVILQNSAISNSVNTTLMTIEDESGLHYGGASFISNQGNHMITTTTIDALDPKNISVIHLDLEGSEYNALVGAQKTIEKYKPVIVIENDEENIQTFLISNSYKKIHAVNGNFVWISF